MGLLITKADFVGRFALAKSNTDNIDSYIELHEEKILMELLGIELFNLFKADVNPATKTPNTQIYLDIYNSMSFAHNNTIVSSGGMKNLLLGFIYFFYVRENKFKQTQNGDVVNQTEVSESANSNYLYIRYNESITTNYAIQLYCSTKVDDTTQEKIYPTFKGTCKKYSIPF